MKREKANERGSHRFGFGDSKRVEVGYEDRKTFAGRKDFRDNLVFIFIDNLYPKVDVACLWGVFKVFGRVRDVFLSSQNRSR